MQQQVNKPQPVTDVFDDSPSRYTRDQYPKVLKKFFEYLELPGETVDEQGQAFLDKARQEPGWANDMVRKYILERRKRVDAGEITAGSLKVLYTPIKMFCDVYDDVTVSINWKRIKKTMPSPQQYSDDRAPKLEEIKKLLDFPDRRIKSIVLIMVSSGMRIGGFEGLKWKHIKPITDEKTGKVVAAQLYVAKNKGGRPYNTFITGECYDEIVKYIDWRKMWGEQITGESWVIRDDFKTVDTKRNSSSDSPEHSSSTRGGLVRRVETPRQLTVRGINRLMVKALYAQGLRETLEKGQKRHEVRTCHGYRKYFFSTATREGIHGLTLEMFIGHKLPESIPSYMKPTPEQFKNEYLKAETALTIYQNVSNIKEQQEVLEKKQEAKDREIQELRAEQHKTRELLNTAISKLMEMVRFTVDHAAPVTEEEKKQKADLEEQLKRLHF